MNDLIVKTAVKRLRGGVYGMNRIRLCEEAADEIERLRAALLDCARRCEALKRPCGMDPESGQALRNGAYMSIALAARAALGPNEWKGLPRPE